MASLESIGSCSLDVEVTASEASECNEDSASERTLRSVSLSTRTPEADCPSKPAQGGASTPEYVKRTARLFEKTTSPASCPAVVNGKSENADGNYEKLTNGTTLAAKKPSYLGLACSISGYSGITTYDSKLREGFRSRDQSPGRLGLIASREVSPLRQGSDSSEGFTVHSVCGNYLVPPTKSITRFAVGTPSSVSDGFIEPQKPLLLNDKLKQNKSEDNFVNGVETFDSIISLDSSIKVKDMGDKSTVITTDGYVKNGSPEITHGKLIDDGRRLSKDPIPRESLSDTVASIRESSKHFMSSMLSSSSFSAISSESCFDRTRAEEPTRSPITQRSHEESAKYSPDTSKTDWKNSLGAPLASPLKRSPGAVRVVEFTSQTKSYVTAVSANGATIQASASMPNQCVRDDAGSLSNSVNTCKSFIQQRVERLYGPGALAQGFFIRTKGLLRDPDDQVSEDALDAEVPVRVTSSSPALPVLRHLRPEFRAQLSVAVPVSRRPQDQPCPQGKVTVIPVEVEKPVLQQQVSVESVPDLQPAAPEVVLPVDPPQTNPDDAVTTTSAKDGHHFLQLLKRELARLDGEARVVEADLEAGAHLSEVTLGKLRAAAGQARLLMTQKLQQFEGLCHKNLAQSSDEPFPTTSEDLAGFWDMVMLQVDQVDGLFAEISELRANNWVEAKPHWEAASDPTVTAPSKRQSVAKKAAPKAVRQETSKQVETARKAREDARRKMMEQRRKMMREKAAATAQADVEIFVPLENGKHV
ncbi:uncharacterized protein LOC134530941 [Bacillus rossius redtenbacheri]|uniref:uncharacterized protein LOC134530941 n=1 Tax=Bacillus rossius redtenbacheri TaxID=93214 RepID=UPI002FDDA093